MSWSMTKEDALRTLAREAARAGRPRSLYSDFLMALSDVEDEDVPDTVARLRTKHIES